jgi:polyhydroxybutyrate depolymerase
VVWLLLLVPLSATADFPAGEVTGRVVQWEGRERNFDVYIPSGYKKGTPLPLVMDFHGFTSNAAQQRQISGYRNQAELETFAVAWPQGVGQPASWNTPLCCGTARQENVDDVGFARLVLRTIASEVAIDPHRVYATGLSNGAAITHRLACEAADIFAAAVPAAYPLPYLPFTGCQTTRPIPVSMVMGLTDALVPYAPNYYFPSAQQSLQFWRQQNSCLGSGPDVTTPLTEPGVCETYNRCDDGVETQLCSVVGIEFPGAFYTGHILYFNLSGYNVAANGWAFMKRFTHPNPNVDLDKDDLTDIYEITIGTDPVLADSDADGADDATEIFWGTDPLDSESLPAPEPKPAWLAFAALLAIALLRFSRGAPALSR